MLPTMKGKDIMKIMPKIGFDFVGYGKGSRHKWKNDQGQVANFHMNSNKPIDKNTFAQMLRQIGLTIPQFMELYRQYM